MSASFFIAAPVATGKTATVEQSTFRTYQSGAWHSLKWSNDKEPPAVGQQITITVNGIGPAIVKGYFAENGYLGVMIFATDPPAWYRKQQGPNLAQLTAIHAWAKLHGRKWKEALRTAWCNGNYRHFGDDACYLQQIRNQYGPGWLIDYEINPRDLKQPAWSLEGIGCVFGAEIDY